MTSLYSVTFISHVFAHLSLVDLFSAILICLACVLLMSLCLETFVISLVMLIVKTYHNKLFVIQTNLIRHLFVLSEYL